MRKMLHIAVLSAVLSIGPSALAQQVELVKDQQSRAEVTFGMYADDASGNQDYVREYDGRDFSGWGIEKLESSGYNGPYQYWLDARSLITGDEDVSFDMSLRDDLEFHLGTSALTHRLGRVPAINPYLSGIINPIDSRPLAGVTSAGVPFGDAFTALSPETDTILHRRVNDFGLRQFIGRSQQIALNADWWQESEDGARQVLFYDSRKYSGPMGIDRSTSQGTLGTDLRIGANSVLNYEVVSTDFTDRSRPVVAGSLLDNIRPPSVRTSSNILKARSRLSGKLYFTGAHSSRSRRNLTAVLPGSNPPANLGNRVDTEATNLGLTFLATDALSLTGRWRSYELDNFAPPVPSAAAPTNFNLSRKVDSMELGASYGGLRHAFLRLGYEYRNTERESGKLHPELEDFETELIRESSKSNILRLGMRYNPSLKLSLSGNAEKWNTDHPGYFGQPTDQSRANLNATYLVRDNFVLYGDLSYSRDENNDLRVEGVIPTPATNADEEFTRRRAAGQGYRSKFSTVNVGAWYGITGKLTADFNVARISTDASGLWVIGYQAAYPPHLPAETQAYKADSSQWSFGLNYTPKPKWRMYGRFYNSSSDGRSSFTTIPGGVTLTEGWVPVDISEKRWTLGLGYDVSATDSLLFDFSTSDWKDRINPANDGRFNLWRLAWSTDF